MAAQGCCEKNANRIGICCFMNEESFKHKPLAEVVQNHDRQCTDIPCCLGLLFVFLSQFALIGYAINSGARPEYLWRGYDFQGNLCNSDNAYGSMTAWPALNRDIQPSPTSLMICLQSCDRTTRSANDPLMTGGDYYESQTFLSSYCVPTNPSNFTSYSSFTTSSEQFDRAVADVNTAKWLIFAAAFAGIVLAFIYLRLVACIGRLLIWLTIVVVAVGGIMLSVLLLQRGADDLKDDESADLGKLEIVLGVILMIFLVMIWLSLFFIRKRIGTAVEMLDEASRAVQDMKSTLIFPCIYSLVGLSYLVFWIFILMYIYSVQSKKEGLIPPTLTTLYNLQPTFVYYEFDQSMKDSVVYHFLCLFYMVQVIIYFGFMVLAGTFGDWYFSEWNTEKNAKTRGYGVAELSYSPILESFFRVLRFHLGSLALGALIITLIRVLRAVVTYIEAKTKAAQNPFTKCLFCVAQCCLRCCQCIFDRISKEGFVFTTIYGTAYCYSSYQALKLLTSNIGRMVLVEGVAHYTELFGRIAIASLNTAWAVLLMYYLPYFQSNVSSFVFPAVIIFVLSWMIASFFMMVLQVAVETIFLCFLIDESVHQTPRFASHKLIAMASMASEAYQKMETETEDNLDDNDAEQQTSTKTQKV